LPEQETWLGFENLKKKEEGMIDYVVAYFFLMTITIATIASRMATITAPRIP
jgi:hypothetical protein